MAAWLHTPVQESCTGRTIRLIAKKGSAYEGGVREPMIVRWPGVLAAEINATII